MDDAGRVGKSATLMAAAIRRVARCGGNGGKTQSAGARVGSGGQTDPARRNASVSARRQAPLLQFAFQSALHSNLKERSKEEGDQKQNSDDTGP
jgi:hypothetical protein